MSPAPRKNSSVHLGIEAVSLWLCSSVRGDTQTGWWHQPVWSACVSSPLWQTEGTGCVLGSITDLCLCAIIAIAGFYPLFLSCPCFCGHSNCIVYLVLCLSASRYFMFWAHAGVEWEFKKRKGGEEVRVWGSSLKCNPKLISVSGVVLECRY